jgi:hypothetical protein
VDVVGAIVEDGAAGKTVSAESAGNAAAVVVAVVVVAGAADLGALNLRRPRAPITTHVRFWRRRRLLQHLHNVQYLHRLQRRRQPTPMSPSGPK